MLLHFLLVVGNNKYGKMLFLKIKMYITFLLQTLSDETIKIPIKLKMYLTFIALNLYQSYKHLLLAENSIKMNRRNPQKPLQILLKFNII